MGLPKMKDVLIKKSCLITCHFLTICVESVFRFIDGWAGVVAKW